MAIEKTLLSVWEICDSCMKYDPEERPTFTQIAYQMEDLRIRAPAPPPSATVPTPSPPPSTAINEIAFASYGHRDVNEQPSAWKLFKRRIQGTKNS